MEEVVTESAPETVETPIVEQAVTTENAEPNVEVAETKPEKTFTQAELNEIITKRIERERESVSKKAAQEARDAYVAEQGIEWNGKHITTEAEYKEALKEQELTERYRSQELPDEVIAELVEGKKFREKFSESEKQSAERAKVESDFLEFTKAFPDAKPEDIPTSVWADVNAGKSLVDAYTKYENQTLKEKLAAVEQAKQIEQKNQENAASSTGSVTGNGSNVPTFFTKKQVEGMSQSEVNKNWDAINTSMKNPKFYE